MNDIKNTKQSSDQKVFQEVLENNKVNRRIIPKAIRAFIVGGLISIIAQGFLDLYEKVAGLESAEASSLMSITIVVIASILTGFGIFDKIGQFSGAGSYIPITGFANSMTSAAIESRSEGIILGIMTNMFKLAGAVIVAGVVSAFISGLIIYLVRLI